MHDLVPLGAVFKVLAAVQDELLVVQSARRQRRQHFNRREAMKHWPWHFWKVGGILQVTTPVKQMHACVNMRASEALFTCTTNMSYTHIYIYIPCKRSMHLRY